MKTKTMTLIAAMTASAAITTIPIRAIAQDQQKPQNKPVLYTVVDLGTLGGSGVTASSINERGWAVGAANLSGDKRGHAFLWRDGKMADLGTLGGWNSFAAIVKTNRGLIPGAAETDSSDPLKENFCFFDQINTPPTQPTGLICRGFVWRDGVKTALPTLGGSNGFANSVNNHGEVVGWAETSTSDPNCASPQALDYEAVVWGPGTADIRTLPPLPGDKVSLAFVNNDRLVAGYSGPCVPPSALIAGGHGVIWEQGHARLLATLGGTITVPSEFNSEGQLTGNSTLQGDGAFHAFLWQNGVMTDLKVLPGDTNSNGNGLNDRGQVVGGSYTQSANSGRPFLWQNGVMTDLSTLIKPGSTALTITFANDINSHGEILATGFDPNTLEIRGVVLIPCDGEHADNKGCAEGDGKAALGSASAARPPWPLLPEQVRAQLQRRFGFGRVGAQ
jgi:probable HAF family extracellular repeat protein